MAVPLLTPTPISRLRRLEVETASLSSRETIEAVSQATEFQQWPCLYSSRNSTTALVLLPSLPATEIETYACRISLAHANRFVLFAQEPQAPLRRFADQLRKVIQKSARVDVFPELVEDPMDVISAHTISGSVVVCMKRGQCQNAKDVLCALRSVSPMLHLWCY